VTYRNRKLLDLAHDAPCFAKFPHGCAQYYGCDPAHSDQQKHGRGINHKSGDHWTAAMCHVAHMMLDTLDRETKSAEWDRAHILYWDWLWENGKVKVA
jgi:hypothetical protein